MKQPLSITTPRNILLVDDDPDDREFFAEAVAVVKPAATIVMKRDGEELMDYLNSGSAVPDVIFLDLNMPRKNGRECLAELRHNDVYKAIPVVIYTTSLNPIDIEDAYNEGASRFFRKPNSFEELKAVLDRLLSDEVPHRYNMKRENFVINRQFKFAR